MQRLRLLSATLASLGLALLSASASHAADTAGPTLDLSPLTGAASPLKAGDRIALLGDSITGYGAGKNGYVWLIEQDLAAKQADKAVELVKAGIPGNKVPDLQKRLERDVLSKQPTVVFVFIGINDVWHADNGKGTSQEDFEAGLNDIIKRIKDSGAIAVLATPSVIGERADGSNKHDTNLDIYADISRKVAKEQQLTLCDLRMAFIDYLKKNNSTGLERGVLTSDRVHLNDAGNILVANHAAASIAEALQKARRK